MLNDLVFDEGLIKLLIKKLRPRIQPDGVELKKLLFSSRLDADFYEVFKIYLPVGKLTVEELDKLTGYSKKFIDETKRTIDSSPVPQQALRNALKGLESARKESSSVRNLMRLNLTTGDGKEWFALDIKEASYNSTVNPIYKNLDHLLGTQTANSKRALTKFFNDALIGYSVAHCESVLYKLQIKLRTESDENVLGTNVLSQDIDPYFYWNYAPEKLDLLSNQLKIEGYISNADNFKLVFSNYDSSYYEYIEWTPPQYSLVHLIQKLGVPNHNLWLSNRFKIKHKQVSKEQFRKSYNKYKAECKGLKPEQMPDCIQVIDKIFEKIIEKNK